MPSRKISGALIFSLCFVLACPVAADEPLQLVLVEDEQPASQAPSEMPEPLPADIEIIELAGCDTCEACLESVLSSPPKPYKGLFYDNDFSYLDDYVRPRTFYFETLKQMDLGGGWQIDVGGEFRHQFKSENRRTLFRPWVPNFGAPTVPRTDIFNLFRTRVYGNLTYQDWLRGYVEYLSANSFHEDLPALPIDENRAAIQNVFADVKLFSHNGKDSWVRIGRQELLYDNQRLISPLDWVNTRRTFQGVKTYLQGEVWDVDAFWTRPVVVDPINFDSVDQSQWFGGFHATYKNFAHQKFAPYFLILREEDILGINRIGGGNGDNRTYTVGSRLNGELDGWFWDLEAAYQFGDTGNVNISAGMVTLGLGRAFSCLAGEPVFWIWYDYASGDDDPADGTINTFNQLFPLSHKYMGFLDLVARQNIHDLNFQWHIKPHKKVTFLTWLHLFWLDEERDGLYNAAGLRSRLSPLGAGGSEVGQEIDLVTNINITPGIDYQVGYSHFWAGRFIQSTGDSADAYLLYTQMSIKF